MLMASPEEMGSPLLPYGQKSPVDHYARPARELGCCWAWVVILETLWSQSWSADAR
jgi:hypothetical protein